MQVSSKKLTLLILSSEKLLAAFGLYINCGSSLEGIRTVHVLYQIYQWMHLRECKSESVDNGGSLQQEHINGFCAGQLKY